MLFFSPFLAILENSLLISPIYGCNSLYVLSISFGEALYKSNTKGFFNKEECGIFKFQIQIFKLQKEFINKTKKEQVSCINYPSFVTPIFCQSLHYPILYLEMWLVQWWCIVVR